MRRAPERLAVLSDVHGNRWALEAVLEDAAAMGATRIAHLGDCVYGPLDPSGTAAIFLAREIPSVSGNEDRLVAAPAPGEPDNPTTAFTREALSGEQIRWLASLPRTLEIGGDRILFHGTPASDTEYLLRAVEASGVRRRSPEEVEGILAGIDHAVVLCGHDHLQAELRLPGGRLVVNPGSVGLPAYTDDHPFPHCMEAGTPHARYSILARSGAGWSVEHRVVEYDRAAAAEAALRGGRPDWAQWLRTGRAA